MIKLCECPSLADCYGGVVGEVMCTRHLLTPRAVEQDREQVAMAREVGEMHGLKFDDGKPDVAHLVVAYFPDALDEVARVSAAGAKKYVYDGWHSVPNGVSRYTAAIYRHLKKVLKGKKFEDDPHPAFAGQNIRHRAQVAWNALASLQLELEAEGLDRSSPVPVDC